MADSNKTRLTSGKLWDRTPKFEALHASEVPQSAPCGAGHSEAHLKWEIAFEGIRVQQCWPGFKCKGAGNFKSVRSQEVGWKVSFPEQGMINSLTILNGLNGIHPRVLKELTNVIMRLLSIIF